MSHSTLVTTDQLAPHLDDPNWIVIDCRFVLSDPPAGRAMYIDGHIPQARFADLDQDLSSPISEQSGRHPLPTPEQFLKAVKRWGINKQTQVVAYDQLGGALASRLWWLMRWMGHRQVAVLEGGYPAWTAQGLPTTADLPEVVSSDFQGTPDNQMWLTSEAVAQNLSSDPSVLVDARDAARYRGEVEPVDPVAGHVPGAINLPFKANLDEQGRFLSAADLHARFQTVVADRQPQDIVHMCGSGVTACHNILAMEVAGIDRADLYVGSWSDWSSHDLPVATGGSGST